MSAPPEFLKWGALVERLLIPTYYRIFSFTSIHAPFNEISKVCEYMAQNTALGGTITWNIPNRILTWDNIIINQNPTNPVTMNIRVFGSSLRNKNTVFVRIGWWKAYFVDTALNRIGARITQLTGGLLPVQR